MNESKTPRTDAAKEFIHDRGMTEWVPAEVSSQIETELAASKAREAKMAETLMTLEAMALEHPAFNSDACDDGDIDAICRLGGDTADWTLIGLYSDQALKAWRAAKCPCSPELNGICPACEDGMEGAK